MNQQDQQSQHPEQRTTQVYKQTKNFSIPSIQSSQVSRSQTLIKIIPQQKIQELLLLIFQHFCKRSYESKPNTFDHIKHEVMVLSLNKFMIFCREFGFLTNKLISMIDLVTIFRKFSTNFKQMNLIQFKNCFVKLAQQCFKNDDNSYRKLLQYMKLTNEQQFKQQMRRLKISIPEKLIAPKHSNRFKIYSHCGKFTGDIKKELELRKQKKIIKAHSIQRKPVTMSPPSANTTKYSMIHANRTKGKFELSNVILMAKQQTQYSYASRNYSSTKAAGISLQNLIEQDEDDVLEQLQRKQQKFNSIYSNSIQQRINKLRLGDETRGLRRSRIVTQNLNRRR